MYVIAECLSFAVVPRLLTYRLKTNQCIAELCCKASHFKETGLIFTINSAGISGKYHNTAIKADSLVSNYLRQGLKAAFEKLRTEQGAEPDWHPRSNDMVQDLVHPSMYPFVYGEYISLETPTLILNLSWLTNYLHSQVQLYPG
jgi:hypothetical protein